MLPDNVLLGDPAALLRLAVVGTAAYVALVALLRLTGKRTLSKMNAFDFVVTIGLGSTLATTLLSRTSRSPRAPPPSRCSSACNMP